MVNEPAVTFWICPEPCKVAPPPLGKPTLTVTWSMVNCPGTVDFTNPHTPSTTGTFSANGQYALRLTACDGELSSSADVRMTVNPISSGQGLPPDPRTVAPSRMGSWPP